MPRLSVAVTESGAATFTQTAQVTGLEGQTTVAFRILEATFESDFHLAATGAADGVDLALYRQSRTAMPSVDDVDVMFKYSVRTMLGGEVGLMSRVIEWKPTRDVLIVEDPIYLAVLGVSTAGAFVVTGEIFYEVVNISAIDRLTLLTQSLSGG
jgi:hypothetical protein